MADPTDRGEQIPVRVVDRRWWARTDSDQATEDEGLRKPTYVEELERRVADQAAQLQAALSDRRHSAEEFDQVKARLIHLTRGHSVGDGKNGQPTLRKHTVDGKPPVVRTNVGILGQPSRPDFPADSRLQ